MSEGEIAYEDWSRRDLSGADHTGVASLDVDLTDVTDTSAKFVQCIFRDCTFSGGMTASFEPIDA